MAVDGVLDPDLLARCLRGEEAAHRELFEAYRAGVLRTAFFITRSWADAEDVTQDTFCRAFAHLSRYDPSRPFRPWLWRIAVNLSHNCLRRRKRWIFWSEGRPEDRDDAALWAGGGIPQPEEQALAGEEARELLAAVGALPDRLRTIVVLKYHNDLTCGEIAAVLGVPVGTVKSRLNKALTLLRRRLAHDTTRPRITRHGAEEVR